MPIFSDPVTVKTNRTFTFVNQTSDSKSIITLWEEFTAAIAAQSRLIIKQSRKRSIVRFLLKRTATHTLVPAPASGSLTAAADWNLTYAGDIRLTEAQIQEELDILLALASQSGFVGNMLHGAG